MFCLAKIQYFHPNSNKIAEILEENLKEPLGHDFVKMLTGDWAFELVISPSDGLAHYLHGLSGPVFSVIAGGPKGVFNTSLNKKQEYLVIAVKSKPANTNQSLSDNLRKKLKSDMNLLETLEEIDLIDKLIDRTQPKKNPKHLTIATHTDNPHENPVFAADLSRYARVCILTGSPFGAGISPYFCKTDIDAAVLVVESTHMILIAAAAAASGNDFYAFPITHARDRDIPRVKPNASIFHKKDLILRDDVFVVMTGISDNLILDGVHYTWNGLAKTHSLCIRSKTYSQRFIDQQHNLKKKRFHHLDSLEPLSYPDVLKRYFHN
jgi:fructose-1,6-bisphosphatase/sedoheptulose 1,7-bisphosphatase-like protein